MIDTIYMKIAIELSKLSFCKKKQVGAIIVKNNRIISNGYNRTPNGFDQTCEDENGKTKWDVIHAEENAILKTASSFLSCKGSTIYVTHFPCKGCCKLIYQSNIKRIIYLYTENQDHDSIMFLKQLKIKIKKLSFIS
ncbi:deoxycytidylate deaminase [Blattabacterium cuenoti]|uniref:deoxycytidylate deaminase n=1 Tax=Blattabacterium cuenoti TaxID=1653831 RepID=UPI00163C28B6|nr:deaminase [Blattabacterium cuenoti]